MHPLSSTVISIPYFSAICNKILSLLHHPRRHVSPIGRIDVFHFAVSPGIRAHKRGLHDLAHVAVGHQNHELALHLGFDLAGDELGRPVAHAARRLDALGAVFAVVRPRRVVLPAQLVVAVACHVVLAVEPLTQLDRLDRLVHHRPHALSLVQYSPNDLGGFARALER